MFMSASESLVGIPRAFNIDSLNRCTIPATSPACGLPYSVSAFDSVSRGIESQGSQGRSTPIEWPVCHTSQAQPSPFTSAPPEACAAFACLNAVQDGAIPSVPARGSLSTNACIAPKDEHPAGFLSATLSTVDSTMQYCNGSLSTMDSSWVGAPNHGQWGPPHGAKAVCGKRTTMEDAYAVQTNFFDLSVEVPASKTPPAGRGSDTELLDNAMAAAFPAGISPCSPTSVAEHLGVSMMSEARGGEMLHFFGVYDGHGGSEAAHHCASRLHHHLFEALSQHVFMTAHTPEVPSPGSGSQPAGDIFTSDDQPMMDGMEPEPAAAAATAAASADTTSQHATEENRQDEDAAMMDERGSSQAMQIPGCGHSCAPQPQAILEAAKESSKQGADPSASITYESSPTPSSFPEAALREAFLKTDNEFAADASAAVVGSTAVVALLGTKKIWIANCGDSRAVLCQAGKAVQLTEDHKPERKDETERVEKAGGHVLYWNGHRVMGILAMSRAIGDHGLRPYIIPEPEISVVTRSDDDEFLLLASDGLWDVMTNQEATDLAARCLTRAIDKGASRKAAARISASVLTKAAIDRGSKDNVTVVMVDLKAKAPDSPTATAPAHPTPSPSAVAVPGSS